MNHQIIKKSKYESYEYKVEFENGEDIFINIEFINNKFDVVNFPFEQPFDRDALSIIAFIEGQIAFIEADKKG